MLNGQRKAGYEYLAEKLQERDVDPEAVKSALLTFEVELPSWVFGTFGGGRFGDYTPPDPALDRFAKLRDAALVHKLTGVCPRVAIHLGWDKPEEKEVNGLSAGDFADLREYALEQGVDIGAVNPTLFLEGTHHGSLSAIDPGRRERWIEHCRLACEVADQYGRGLVTYWFPDGSLYPGQRHMWEQERLIREGMEEIYNSAPETVEHLIEYKLFEPGTYSTVVSDYGVALDIARALGERAGVLVDLGHHAHGVNVAQIVARLLGLGIKGGFHFNTRYAADDDQAVEPNRQVYEIFCQLTDANAATGDGEGERWTFMLDQACSLENRIKAVLHSIDSLQISLARSLILDRSGLKEARQAGEVMDANRIYLDAFLTDVRPLVEAARVEAGLPPDPVTELTNPHFSQT